MLDKRNHLRSRHGWNPLAQQCVPVETTCPTDLNGDQVTGVSDLLIFLAMFAIDCP